MISGELETNGDHWRTLAASFVRLSLSHHDQTSEVRRGQEGPMSPSDPTSVSLSARTHLASGHSHVQPNHLPFYKKSTDQHLFI